MCFMLFVATDKALPLKEWREDAPGIWVGPLRENEAAVRGHFNKPVVQYVGSTSGCGCDFPHWILFNGEVPTDGFDGRDEGLRKVNYENAKNLVKLLRDSSETSVEIYSVWAGNESNPPLSKKSITIEGILMPTFLFGEQVFYQVRILS